MSVLLLTLAACDDKPGPMTQIVVVVDSDLGVPDQLDGLKISVSGTVKSSLIEAALDAEHPLPRSLGVVHSGGPLGPVRVSAVGTHAGEMVVERLADVYFEQDRTLKLALPLTHECWGEAGLCDSDQTCDRGTCVPSALADLPQFRGDDGSFLDGGMWLVPMPDAGGDSGPDAMSPRTDAGDAGQDSAADGGGDSGMQHQSASCRIEEPEADKVFYVGDPVSFRGSCDDPASGELAARWNSKLDGNLGAKDAFTKTDLSEGSHEISLCADGKTGLCAKLTIVVQAVPDVVASITSLAQTGKVEGVYSNDGELVAKGTATGVPPFTYRWIDSFAGDMASTETAHYDTPLLAGKHSLRLIVTDSRQRSAQTERQFVVQAATHDTLFEQYTRLNNERRAVDSNFSISAIASDGGFHYVGTTSGSLLGLTASNPPATAGYSTGPGGLPNVSDVFVRGGVLYAATSSDVQRCTANGEAVGACMPQPLNGLSGASVPARVSVVKSGADDFLLVGTSQGLWTGNMKMLDNGGLRENKTTFSGMIESAGSVWIAASMGLFSYPLGMPLTSNPKKIDDGGPSGLTAIAASADTIWTALSAGIACYDAGDKRWTTWTTNYDKALFGRLVSNEVRSIAITHPMIEGAPHDVIWIGTSSGLSRFDPAIPSFTTYAKADGLPDNLVQRVLGLPNNELLIATQMGLAIYRGQ